MTDGEAQDEKVIAVPVHDPSFNCYDSIYQLPKHLFDEVSNFFEVYKTLEGVSTKVNAIKGEDDAINIIKECIDNYKTVFSK